MKLAKLILFLPLLLIFLVRVAMAFDYGLSSGILLPNQIKNVTEILPYWSAEVSADLSSESQVQLVYSNANASNVYWNAYELFFKQEFTEKDSSAFYYFGPAYSSYDAAGQGFKNVIGGRVGGGGAFQISQRLWVKADMSLRAQPGISLLLGLGFFVRDR